jgi:pimeloyl-ACP methyl ester carboxylesterase
MSEPYSHRYLDLGGIRTHYLEAGPASGGTIVLLHSGEFGAGAELCWERMIGGLAARHHVIAPDWLGFGESDRIYDFGGGAARRLRHMTLVLDELGVRRALFVGNSMGGTALARVAASHEPPWPMAGIALISGGGFAPDNEARRATLAYDGTPNAMREIMRVLMFDASWALEDEYIERRVAQSREPGAWEVVSAARFKAPWIEPRSQFGQPDSIEYEQITVPALVIAGAEDRLRQPGYAHDLAARIPDSALRVYERCGHMANLEFPGRVVEDLQAFAAGLELESTCPPDLTGELMRDPARG